MGQANMVARLLCDAVIPGQNIPRQTKLGGQDRHDLQAGAVSIAGVSCQKGLLVEYHFRERPAVSIVEDCVFCNVEEGGSVSGSLCICLRCTDLLEPGIKSILY